MIAKRVKCKIAAILYIMPLFILGLFQLNLFALPAEFEMIEKLEKQEKQAPAQRIIRPNLEYKAEGFRDPFKEPIVQKPTAAGIAAGPESAETPPPLLNVQGLIWGGALPQAIINDKVVKIGDSIEGARITNIAKDGVTVLFEGRQYNLSSPAASIVKKP